MTFIVQFFRIYVYQVLFYYNRKMILEILIAWRKESYYEQIPPTEQALRVDLPVVADMGFKLC